MRNSIVITGFMGTGKSSVGKEVARSLDTVFYDTDSMIEKQTGMTINEIFEQLGEEEFRQIESNIINKLEFDNNIVIATGGGTLLNENNQKLIFESGIVFCLKTDAKTIHHRLAEYRDRPLLAGNETIEHIKTLLKKREVIYRLCPFQIDTSNLTINEVTRKVIKLYETEIRRQSENSCEN